jgi:hypothetical protein
MDKRETPVSTKQTVTRKPKLDELLQVEIRWEPSPAVTSGCDRDGCNRINFCGCDCNDSSGTW